MDGRGTGAHEQSVFSCWSDEAAQRLEIPMKTEFKKLSIGNQSKVALLLALRAGSGSLGSGRANGWDRERVP